MFVVNCSWLLKTGWVVIRGFLDAKTRDKIHILGSNYQAELLKFIDKENLPEFLGGTCRCEPNGCLGQLAGPWKEYYDKFHNDEDPNDFRVPDPPKWREPGQAAAEDKEKEEEREKVKEVEKEEPKEEQKIEQPPEIPA